MERHTLDPEVYATIGNDRNGVRLYLLRHITATAVDQDVVNLHGLLDYVRGCFDTQGALRILRMAGLLNNPGPCNPH